MNFAYTGKAQSVTLEPGKYVLECWGAQGGYRSNSSYGGKGGYSTGTLTLTQKTTIYIYVGGSGNSVTSASNSIYPGGFNGGGYRYNYKGGGGATDIRIGSASLYAVLSLQVAVVLMVVLIIVVGMQVVYLVLGEILDVVHMDMVDLKLLHIHL